MVSHRMRLGRIGNDPVVNFAVTELSRYLKMMDRDLQVDILQADKVEQEFPRIIWVGLDEGLAKNVPAVEDPVLDDAIAIEAEDFNGYITGSNSRSVLMAAYRFLRELGCSWVRPGIEGERIPEKRLEKMQISVNEKASYRHRGVCIEGATAYETVVDMLDFFPKVGMNAYFFEHFEPLIFFRRWYNHKSNPHLDAESVSDKEILAMLASLEREMAQRGIVYHKTGHGWTCVPFGLDGSSWGAADDSKVPEETRKYMALVNGRRGLHNNIPLNTNMCYSQSAVRKKMTDAIVAYCKEHPNVDVLHYWLSDGTNNHCECDECAKMLPSDWYMMLLNELDAAMTAEGLTTKVVFLLYVDLLWAPEKIRLNNPDRFILMFAPITRNYGQNYVDHLTFDGKIPEFNRNHLDFDASLEMNLAQLRLWQEQFTGDSFIYDYHLMYAHFNDPGYEHCASNTFQDMKGLRDIGINGNISCQLMRCCFPTALPMLALAAALWNRDADYEKLADSYYLDAFGPDGALVRGYMKKISELFRIYEGPSHGFGAKITGDLCESYAELTQLVENFRPVIDEHAAAGQVWSNDWVQLQVHADYVLALAKALELTQQKNHEEAKQAIAQMLDILNRNELIIKKTMDCNKAKMHWERRLDPKKCQSVDVM